MAKLILSKTQVEELVRENKHSVDEKVKFISRCIDGRYENVDDLPSLAIAGADAGELAIIFAAANEYGFVTKDEKVFQSLASVVGGVKNLRFHTDEHGGEEVLEGCGHIKQMRLDPDAYRINAEQVDFIKNKAKSSLLKGAQQISLKGGHMEGAVLIISGNWGVKPQYFFEEAGIKKLGQVFIFHKTLVDARHRVLTKKLIGDKAVKLFEGCDDEYLYEVLSNTTENHLFETVKRLAPGLSIYLVNFAEDGGFKIEEA